MKNHLINFNKKATPVLWPIFFLLILLIGIISSCSTILTEIQVEEYSSNALQDFCFGLVNFVPLPLGYPLGFKPSDRVFSGEFYSKYPKTKPFSGPPQFPRPAHGHNHAGGLGKTDCQFG